MRSKPFEDNSILTFTPWYYLVHCVHKPIRKYLNSRMSNKKLWNKIFDGDRHCSWHTADYLQIWCFLCGKMLLWSMSQICFMQFVKMSEFHARWRRCLLQTEGGNAQRDPRGELGEEDIERVEDGFVAAGFGVLQFEIVHHIWQHGPEGVRAGVRVSVGDWCYEGWVGRQQRSHHDIR